jgi:uncharacterized protein with gpF-like domain
MPVIEGLIEQQTEQLNAEFGMQFNVRDLLAEAWFEDYMAEFAQDILDTTKKDVSLLLQQGRRDGWTIDEMSKQLELTWERYLDPDFTTEGRRLTDEEVEWFQERQPRYRRDSIARTETIKASNAGSLALYDAWGVVELKSWQATRDDRTRATHLQAWFDYSPGGDPGPIRLNETFSVGNSELMFPGDPNGEPEEVIECRCTVLPFFEEVGPTEEEIASEREAIQELIAQAQSGVTEEVEMA